MCGKHFSQGLKGSVSRAKRTPPTTRMAPAEPTQATDQDSSWCSGTWRSLESSASTDWWKTSTERRTRMPSGGGGRGFKQKRKGTVRIISPISARTWWRAVAPDRMKQKEAGLRKKGTPLLRDMVMQMEPMAIMVRLRRASTAAVRFRSTGEGAGGRAEKVAQSLSSNLVSKESGHAHSGSFTGL